MSLDSVAKAEQKTQKEKSVAVETFKELVDRRQYKEARTFLEELSEELYDYVGRDVGCKVYLRELSFTSL